MPKDFDDQVTTESAGSFCDELANEFHIDLRWILAIAGCFEELVEPGFDVSKSKLNRQCSKGRNPGEDEWDHLRPQKCLRHRRLVDRRVVHYEDVLRSPRMIKGIEFFDQRSQVADEGCRAVRPSEQAKPVLASLGHSRNKSDIGPSTKAGPVVGLPLLCPSHLFSV